MTIYVLPAAEQRGPIPVAYPDCAGDVVVNRYEIDLGSAPLKGVTLAADDILDIGIIPATAQVVDVVIDSDWNRRPAIRGRGSAIFIHLRRAEGGPTAGCIALSPRDMRILWPRLGRRTRLLVH